MNELHVILTGEERQYLVDLLKMVLKDTRVEEHRTRAPLYREAILHREDVIGELLNKLEGYPVSTPL